MSVGPQDISMFDRLAADREGSPFLHALVRRWWVIVLVAVIGGVAGYLFAQREPKRYTATAALLFTNPSLDQQLANEQVLTNLDPNRLAATNQALVELPTVSNMVAGTLHIPASRVSSEVSFGSTDQSDVMPISVIDSSPSMAAAIANNYVRDYIAFRIGATDQELAAMQTKINNEIAALGTGGTSTSTGQQLVNARTQLNVLKSEQDGDAQVVQTSSAPTSPSSPNPKRDGLVGLLLGLLVGAGLVSVLQRRDRKLRTVDEVEQIYGARVIGTIAESPTLTAGGAGSARDEEAFMMIRAQLRYFGNRNIRRVLVTSAEAGEGKTLVSLNLARAAARTDVARALLIETDMRRPTLSKLVGRGSTAGLSELLSYEHDLEAGLRELVVTPDVMNGNGDRPGQLDVLLAGSTPPNPVELLESKWMSELLEVADSMYDMVIVDTPPIGVISDAIPLFRRVDGLILISRLGVTRRDQAARLMKRFRGLDVEILGVVVNGVKATTDPYYTYYEDPKEPRTASPRRLLSRQKTRH